MIKCNLKILMAKYNTTRKELSEKTDIGLNSIGRYINNDWVKFDKEHMDALCKFFDCDISELITFENENQKNSMPYYNSLQSFSNLVDSRLYMDETLLPDEDNYYIYSEDDHNEKHSRNTSTDEIFKRTLMELLNGSIYRNKK